MWTKFVERRGVFVEYDAFRTILIIPAQPPTLAGTRDLTPVYRLSVPEADDPH